MLVTKERFSRLQDDLTKQEYAELLKSIEEEKGNRVAIVVMDSDVIVDGHHRYKACEELGYDPLVEEWSFPGETQDERERAAEEWALREQLGRRNLTPQKFKLLVGRLYNNRKGGKGGQTSERGNAAEEIARETGLSKNAVTNAGKRAEAHDSLTDSAKQAVNSNKVSDSEIQELSELPPEKQDEVAKEIEEGDTSSLKRKPKAKATERSPAKVAEQLSRQFVSPLVRGIDNLASMNGWDGNPKTRGKHHSSANAALNKLIAALKAMREGKK